MVVSIVPLIVAQHGGSATRAQVLEMTTAATLASALRSGAVARHRRGVYGLPDDGARSAAARLGVHLSHRTAALHHGWGVLRTPEQPEAIASRTRRIPRSAELDLRFRTVTADELGLRTTRPLRTVIDCARDLPLPEALAVADSALRSGLVTVDELLREPP